MVKILIGSLISMTTIGSLTTNTIVVLKKDIYKNNKQKNTNEINAFAKDLSPTTSIDASAVITEVKKGMPFTREIAKKLGINLPSNLKGIILTYHHQGADKDGTLDVNINIAKGNGIAKDKLIQVQVSGINDSKAIQNIADAFNKKITKRFTSKIAIVGFYTPLLANKAKNLGIVIPEIAKQLGVTLEYKHSLIKTNGLYDVKIKITKKFKKVKIIIIKLSVTNLDEAKIALEVTRKKWPIIKSSSLCKTASEIQPKDFEITPLDNDLTSRITKVVKSQTTTRVVIVTITISSSNKKIIPKTYQVEWNLSPPWASECFSRMLRKLFKPYNIIHE